MCEQEGWFSHAVLLSGYYTCFLAASDHTPDKAGKHAAVTSNYARTVQVEEIPENMTAEGYSKLHLFLSGKNCKPP